MTLSHSNLLCTIGQDFLDRQNALGSLLCGGYGESIIDGVQDLSDYPLTAQYETSREKTEQVGTYLWGMEIGKRCHISRKKVKNWFVSIFSANRYNTISKK